ncbi:hypothetical protein [Bradyrhizobium sp. STM 3562]|uniref:hypothetical protein n=1 Tax=Bradyrhizobium sp. STM 3562 TaxID=578924 RepID=UPI0038906A04
MSAHVGAFAAIGRMAHNVEYSTPNDNSVPHRFVRAEVKVRLTCRVVETSHNRSTTIPTC